MKRMNCMDVVAADLDHVVMFIEGFQYLIDLLVSLSLRFLCALTIPVPSFLESRTEVVQVLIKIRSINMQFKGIDTNSWT
jgi:hypothetical protein